MKLEGDKVIWDPRPWPKHKCWGCGAEIDRSLFIKGVKFRICCDCLYKAVAGYIEAKQELK